MDSPTTVGNHSICDPHDGRIAAGCGVVSREQGSMGKEDAAGNQPPGRPESVQCRLGAGPRSRALHSRRLAAGEALDGHLRLHFDRHHAARRDRLYEGVSRCQRAVDPGGDFAAREHQDSAGALSMESREDGLRDERGPRSISIGFIRSRPA